MARGPRRSDPDERRAQLVELGLRLFGERSYDELSIDDIARAAGISKGLLYHYFPSKRDFYVETVRSAAQLLLDRTDPTGGPEPEALLTALDAYLTFVEEHAGAFVALMRSGVGQDAEVTAVLESTRARYVARITERLGITDPAPRLRIALRGWLGMVEAASLEWLGPRDLPRDELRDLLAQLLAVTLVAVGVDVPAGAT